MRWAVPCVGEVHPCAASNATGGAGGKPTVPEKVVAGRKRQHAADHERPCHRKGSFEAGDRRDPAPCQVPPPWTPVHPRRPRWNWC